MRAHFIIRQSVQAVCLYGLLVAAPVLASSDGACDWPDDRTVTAILPVATDNGSHASGVVYARNRVVTAAHAVEGSAQFYVRLDKGYRAAELMYLDHESDLAILEVDTGTIAPLPLALQNPYKSQPVWAVGFPLAGPQPITSAGLFQRARAGALHTSAPIDSGQSGGGLLTCEHGSYRLVGILRGYGAYLQGDHYVKLKNHSVSVASATILRFLQNTLQQAAP